MSPIVTNGSLLRAKMASSSLLLVYTSFQVPSSRVIICSAAGTRHHNLLAYGSVIKDSRRATQLMQVRSVQGKGQTAVPHIAARQQVTRSSNR